MVGRQRSILFTKEQWAWIEREAAEIGITFSDVVRRIVDQARRVGKVDK